MNLKILYRKFNTQKKCVTYLEKLRWKKKIICPYCNSKKTRRLKSENRHHCNNCKRNFSVLIGTIFEHTRLPLPEWFETIFLMVNAKRGISARYMMRIMDIPYKTIWYSAMRIRCGMIENCNVLQNIIEMDEAYTGGKPRKKYSADTSAPNVSKVTSKRGRGTKKTPVVGIVERNGKIVLRVIERLSAKNLIAMLNQYVNTDKAIVITDDFKSYRQFDKLVAHLTIKHSKKQYAKGMIHTNTMESFFSILKNSIKGNYISISKKYLPFYLVNAAYIFNQRNFKGDLFESYMRDALSHNKCMKYYKPTGEPKELIKSKCQTI